MKSEWQLAILRLMLASPSEVRSLHSSTSPHFASQPPSPMEKFLAWLTATAIFARPCKSRFYQQAQPSTHRLWANRDAHTETVDHLGGGWVGGGGGVVGWECHAKLYALSDIKPGGCVFAMCKGSLPWRGNPLIWGNIWRCLRPFLRTDTWDIWSWETKKKHF